MDSMFAVFSILFMIAVAAGFLWVCLNPKQTTSIINMPANKKTGFWRRQFQLESTKNQRVFDWTFGIILPVICFAFDPIVFKTEGGMPLADEFKPFAYLLSFVSIMAMMAWLIWGERLEWLNPVFTGLFAVGGTISLIIGFCLFPFSLLGLLVLIGILGFTPLFTSIVYLRNAVRAYKTSVPFFEDRTLFGAAVLGGIFAFVIPITINFEINRLTEKIFDSGDAAAVSDNGRLLKIVSPVVSFERLQRHYHSLPESDEKKEALRNFLIECTGIDPEFVGRSGSLFD